MLPMVLCLTWLSILPLGAGVINCRTACRRCRGRAEPPDMLEVYCAMCDECKERRKEWLEGAPSLLRVEKNEDYVTNYDQLEQEDCPTTPIDEDCDEHQLLTQSVATTTTSTTTSTTTTTTRKPCPPRPRALPSRSPCYGIPCPVPMAIPLCQMCPMPMSGSFYSMTPASVGEATTEAQKKLAEISPATTELYFYLGVPKKLLKQLQLSRSQN